MPQSARKVVVLPAPLAPSRVDDAALGDREIEAVEHLGRAVERAEAAGFEQPRAAARGFPR